MGFLRPRKLDKAKIEARVAEAPPADSPVEVVPLASGFFQLERMRAAHVAKHGGNRKLRGK